jgi:predicted acylesterase/phospholipase RssA
MNRLITHSLWWCHRVASFVVSLAEAILKCGVAFAIAFVAVYPLIAVGQGREAMMAMFSADPWNISWFVIACALSYSSVLTFFFLHFLLGEWNYRARRGGRSFIRIWLPAALTLCIALIYPVAAELGPQHSRVWDAMIGLVNVVLVLGVVIATWWWTKPIVSVSLAIFLATSSVLLLTAFLFELVLLLYGVALIALTVFCAWVRRDFRDQNPNLRRGAMPLRVCLAAALFVVAITVALVWTAVPLRMLLGTPSLILFGFSFLIAIAFGLAALLSRVSPVLVRLAWLGLAALLVLSPIGREPLRFLEDQQLAENRPLPSEHFLMWLQARADAIDAIGADESYPVFFVAAQGGGIRAAYWTSTLLAALEERYPGFTEHVYAISGVSGGSVGAAVFAAMIRELPARRDRGCAPLVEAGVHGLRPCLAYVFKWDMLGPPIGALLFNDIPFGWQQRRRARDLEQSLEYAWVASVESRTFEEPLQNLWRGDAYRIPSLILNSTSAQDGHRIVVSNLRAQGELTVEKDVEAQLGHPVRLSTAAFASARFPIISPEATFTVTDGPRTRLVRLVDGGYFNNAGTTSIASLLRVVLPKLRAAKAGRRVKPIVLVLASDAVEVESKPGFLQGSLAEAIGEPVAVLAQTGSAHEATYLREIAELIGREESIFHMRPKAGSKGVALGWLLSDATRCEMDRMVNYVVNESDESKVIATALRASDGGKLTWQSCEPDNK